MDTPKLYFKVSEIDELESDMKGYRNDVFVIAPNGNIYEVFFYHPTRLAQDLGQGEYLAHPGLIIVNRIDRKTMEQSVAELWQRGFFDYFKPINSLTQKHFEESI